MENCKYCGSKLLSTGVCSNPICKREFTRFNWVDCKEHLPTEIKQYLVRTADDTIEVDLRTPCEKDTEDIFYAFRLYNAKQWCELPKPYYPYCSEEFLAENPWVCGTSGMLEAYYRDRGDGYYLTCDKYGCIRVTHLQRKDWQTSGYNPLFGYAMAGTAIMFIG